MRRSEFISLLTGLVACGALLRCMSLFLGTKRTNRVGLIVSVEWVPESGRRAVKVALLTKADIGHNGATLDHNGFHGHSCSDERSELRPLADQRVGLASAAIRSLMAPSNWLAEAANINPVSS
jgi:hypothetical protein